MRTLTTGLLLTVSTLGATALAADWPQWGGTPSKNMVAPEGATGLLEARVGRMSKDLSLAWSRLAKD